MQTDKTPGTVSSQAFLVISSKQTSNAQGWSPLEGNHAHHMAGSRSFIQVPNLVVITINCRDYVRCLFRHLHVAALHTDSTCCPLQVNTLYTFEVFATRIKIFDWQKVCLIAWSFFLKLLITWFFTSQKSDCSHAFLIVWFSQFGGDLDPLISSHKGLWLPDSILNRKRFYTGHISDY